VKLRACFVIVSFLVAVVCTTQAQTAASNSSPTSTQVPRLIKFSGLAQDETKKPLSGVVGITFSLYKDQQGGSPLWVETQNVQVDASGHYTAMLGSASAEGVPLSLFSSGEAHWISTQVSGHAESARVLLLSVPYALKAADAETLGGLPASAFIHANPGGVAAPAGSRVSSAAAGKLAPATVTGSGTKNFVPLWTGTATLGNSTIYETGGKVGVGTKTPQAELDVVGSGVRGIQATVPGTQAAISGIATATSGGTTGTYGQSSDPTGNALLGVNEAKTGGFGVIGTSAATTGSSYGVYGATASTTNFAAGVAGAESATTGQVFGVAGSTGSSTTGAAGVNGYESSKTGQVFGVFGSTTSATNFAAGVSGNANATTGQVYGVVGVSNSTTAGAAAVNGYEPATTGGVYGVSGSTPSTSGSGVVGNATATSGNTNGVAGLDASPNGSGVNGSNSSGTCCFAAGVFGQAVGGTGVLGSASATSGLNFGVQGISASSAGIGVQAGNTPTGEGVSLAAGTFLVNAYVGKSGEFNVDNSGNGFFAGNLTVKGNVSKGGGSFKIDHPLDPANKYLSHSFVESPDMMNVYNGNITTDRHGFATVNLPDYFEALNGDFRYQLTVIGQFAQAIVAKKISANRFVIRTNRPNVEVSWQVTGVRHDAYANRYRIPVEEDKALAEQGYYLHPEVFGQPESKSISAAGKSAPASQEVMADAAHK
jgi:trimeric autotransporter adhesin